jgi:lysozyme family protein
MPTCQRCGTHIPASQRLYRRELYNGTTQRVNYGKRVSYGTSTHYTIKNVCRSCADELDQNEKSRKNKKTIRLLVLAILIVIYFLLK